MNPCCNDKCSNFSYFFEKNCDRGKRQMFACHKYIAMKKKDPCTPVPEELNEKFLVTTSMKVAIICSTLEKAEKEATSPGDRLCS